MLSMHSWRYGARRELAWLFVGDSPDARQRWRVCLRYVLDLDGGKLSGVSSAVIGAGKGGASSIARSNKASVYVETKAAMKKRETNSPRDT